MTSSVAGLRSAKALPKAKLAPKKDHGQCLVVCCWSDWLQLSESQQNYHIWKICLARWWDHQKLQHLQLVLINRKGPILLHDNACPTAYHTTNASKVEQIGLSFASSARFSWPLANQLPLLQASWQLFSGKTLSQAAEGRKCFPRVHRILKHGVLHYRNKQTSFLLAKMCWL